MASHRAKAEDPPVPVPSPCKEPLWMPQKRNKEQAEGRTGGLGALSVFMTM